MARRAAAGLEPDTSADVGCCRNCDVTVGWRWGPIRQPFVDQEKEKGIVGSQGQLPARSRPAVIEASGFCEVT